MSQYPIVSNDGILEAVNYLASGPSGLGQNFQGFSDYQPAYLTGNFRQPFTIASTGTNNPPSWFVDPVDVSNITPLNVIDGKTANYEWTFTTPQPVPPFTPGQTIKGRGFVDNGTAEFPAGDFFDGAQGYVLTCSTTSVITQFSSSYLVPTVITYGNLRFNNSETKTSTDANARVTVTGPTEQVFISSQLALQSGYWCDTTSTFNVTVQINRYVGFIDTAGQGATDYLFSLDKTVSEQTTTFTVEPGEGYVNAGQNIFTTVLDQPSFGYYWYIADVTWSTVVAYRYDNFYNVVIGEFWNGDASGTGTGTPGTYNTVTTVTVTGSGVGATVDVEIDGTSTDYADSASVYVNNGGFGYAVGDTFTVLGTDLGGLSPDNDLLCTITEIHLLGDALPIVQTVGLRSLTAQVIKQ